MVDKSRFKKPDDFKFPQHFINADGKKIRYGHAEPKGQTKGTVVITTGYADFTESYFETINDFLDRGYAVWMMDWQGQGGSERYYSDSRIPSKNAPTDNIRDLKQFRHDIVKADKNIPIFIVSHSMGGHMAMHYMKDNPKDFDGAILATPFIDSKFDKKGELKAKFMVAAACRLGFGHKRVSRNDNIVRRIKEVRKRLKKEEPIRMTLHQSFAKKDKTLKIGDPTFYWARAMLYQTIKLRPKKVLESIKTPTLFALCENDKLVSNKAIERAARIMPNAKIAKIKDGYHGLWTERQRIRDDWWKHIDNFLTEQTGLFHRKRFNNSPKRPKPPTM